MLIVGAGINGAVSAAALAAGGAATALVDRGDFAAATSQESSNLIWGGVKYLEQLELPLVWKLCGSRNELVRSYPANIREIRFYVAVTRQQRSALHSVPLLWAGIWLYWIVGRGFTRVPRLLTPGRIAREEPAIAASIVAGGIEYSDAYLVDNDARFVFGFVRSALDHGAAAANYVEARSFRRDEQGLWRCTALDRVSGRDFEIRARTLVNAAGPWADALNASIGVRSSTHHLFSKGIHLVVDRITDEDRVLAFFDETDRMFFVIPMGPRSVIGTTDTRVERPEIEVTDADRRLLFDSLNRRLRLARPIGAADVIAERCGVRPLAVAKGADAASQTWTSLSRRHVIEVDRERRAIAVFGGKLTDCLNVGREVSALAEELGAPQPQRGRRWYGEPPSEQGREFANDARRAGLDESLSRRLWRRYGTAAAGMLDEIARDPRLADPVIEGAACRRVELHFTARSEMVVRLEDFLRRRTKLALVRRREELRRAAGLREACEILVGERAEEWIDEYFGG